MPAEELAESARGSLLLADKCLCLPLSCLPARPVSLLYLSGCPFGRDWLAQCPEGDAVSVTQSSSVVSRRKWSGQSPPAEQPGVS